MDKTAFQWSVEPLRKYARFSGRASRAEYWWFCLLIFPVQCVGAAVDALSHTKYAGGAIGIALLLPSLAVYVRRLHDRDHSGWWQFLPLVAIVPVAAGLLTGGAALFAKTGPSGPGLIFVGIGAVVFIGTCVLLFIWLCLRGTVGTNRFGKDPLDPMDDVVQVFS